MNQSFPYTPDMPVSEKFYIRLCERVRTILADCQFSDAACRNRQRRIMYLINRYLQPKAGLVAPQGEDTIANIIFQSLRAEIDAAVERSRRARAVAARRRALRSSAAGATTPGATTVSRQSEPTDTNAILASQEASLYIRGRNDGAGATTSLLKDFKGHPSNKSRTCA